MTLIVMAMLLMAAGWAQSLMPPLLVLGQTRPPLIAAVVVFYAIRFPAPVMLGAAILGGVLYDANSLLTLGVSSLYYCAAGLLIRQNQATWIEGGRISAGFLTMATAVGQFLITAMVGILVLDRAVWLPDGWLRHMFMTALLAGVAGAVVWGVGQRLHRMTGTLEEAMNP